MVYYLNKSKSSINDLCNEYALSVDEAMNEYNMSILSDKYNFICENGYEMPINEAEEKKQGFFKRLIERIKAALKKLCDKAVSKLKSFMSNHPESKLNPFINNINNIFTKASNKLDKSKNENEAKSISNDAGEEVKNTTEEATKKPDGSSTDKKDIVEVDKEVNVKHGDLKIKGVNIDIDSPIYKEEFEKIVKYIPKIENKWDKIVDASVSIIKNKYKDNKKLSEDYIKDRMVLIGIDYMRNTRNIRIKFRYNPTKFISVMKIKI